MNKYSSGYALMQMLSLLGVIVIVCSVVLGIFIFAMNDRLSDFMGITAIIYGGFSGLVLMGMGAIGGAILDGSMSQQNTEKEIGRLIEEIRKSQGAESSISNTPEAKPSLEKVASGISLIKNYKGYEIFRNGKIFYIKGVDGVYTNISDAEKWVDEKSHLLKRD
jgi:chitinase